MFEKYFDAYRCECNSNDCKLTFEDETWESARELLEDDKRDSTSILHPKCKTLKSASVILKTKEYVFAKTR